MCYCVRQAGLYPNAKLKGRTKLKTELYIWMKKELVTKVQAENTVGNEGDCDAGQREKLT